MGQRYLESSGLKGQDSQRASGHVLRDQLNTACRLSENQLHKLSELHQELTVLDTFTEREPH